MLKILTSQQRWVFKPVWTAMWISLCCALAKLFGHSGHGKGFLPARSHVKELMIIRMTAREKMPYRYASACAPAVL